MKDFYKSDDDGDFTVQELIDWLEDNCTGAEQCVGIGGGNVSITYDEDQNKIVFE